MNGTDPGQEPAEEAVFGSLQEFLSGYLAPAYRRAVDGRNRTWCPQWWAHPEAVLRLEALWQSWEVLNLEPGTGLSTWLRDHADHHMTVLLDPEGPFRGCSPEKGHHDRLEPLPLAGPPPGR